VLLREEDNLILRAQYGSLSPLMAEGETFPCKADFWKNTTDGAGIEVVADLERVRAFCDGALVADHERIGVPGGPTRRDERR